MSVDALPLAAHEDEETSVVVVRKPHAGSRGGVVAFADIPRRLYDLFFAPKAEYKPHPKQAIPLWWRVDGWNDDTQHANLMCPPWPGVESEIEMQTEGPLQGWCVVDKEVSSGQ